MATTTPENASSAYKSQIKTIANSLRTIAVGADAAYTTVQDAIDAIADSSLTVRYLVQVEAGSYDWWSFGGKTGIHVSGPVGGGMIVDQNTTGDKFVNVWSTSCGISNMHFEMDDNAAPSTIRKCLGQAGGACDDFTMSNITFNITAASGRTAPIYAWNAVNAGGNIRADNLTIVTASSGILVPNGYGYWTDVFIYLVGNETGIDRAGLNIIAAGHSGRNYFYGGYIGGAQGETVINASGVDVYGLYIDAACTNTGFRVEFYNTTIYARNASATPGEICCVWAANGWVRMFGCMMQSEDQGAGYQELAVYAARDTASEPGSGSGGRVDVYACRLSGVEGGVNGNSSVGIRRISADTTMEKLESGIIEVDASAGDVDITLDTDSNSNNESLTVINTHHTNVVTIVSGGSTTINGFGADLVVPNLGSVTLIRSGQYDWWTPDKIVPFKALGGGAGGAISHTGDTAYTTLVTIPFGANELKAGDALKIGFLFDDSDGTSQNEFIVASDTASNTAYHHYRNLSASAVTVRAEIFLYVTSTTSITGLTAGAQAGGVGPANNTPSVVTVDTTAGVDILLACRLVDASDTMTLHGYYVEHLKS